MGARRAAVGVLAAALLALAAAVGGAQAASEAADMALHKPHGRFAVPGHGRSAPRQQWDAYFKRRQLRGSYDPCDNGSFFGSRKLKQQPSGKTEDYYGGAPSGSVTPKCPELQPLGDTSHPVQPTQQPANPSTPEFTASGIPMFNTQT